MAQNGWNSWRGWREIINIDNAPKILFPTFPIMQPEASLVSSTQHFEYHGCGKIRVLLSDLTKLEVNEWSAPLREHKSPCKLTAATWVLKSKKKYIPQQLRGTFWFTGLYFFLVYQISLSARSDCIVLPSFISSKGNSLGRGANAIMAVREKRRAQMFNLSPPFSCRAGFSWCGDEREGRRFSGSLRMTYFSKDPSRADANKQAGQGGIYIFWHCGGEDTKAVQQNFMALFFPVSRH